MLNGKLCALGMYVVKGSNDTTLKQQGGGYIKVTSAVGEGSTFSAFLPQK